MEREILRQGYPFTPTRVPVSWLLNKLIVLVNGFKWLKEFKGGSPDWYKTKSTAPKTIPAKQQSKQNSLLLTFASAEMSLTLKKVL